MGKKEGELQYFNRKERFTTEIVKFKNFSLMFSI